MHMADINYKKAINLEVGCIAFFDGVNYGAMIFSKNIETILYIYFS